MSHESANVLLGAVVVNLHIANLIRCNVHDEGGVSLEERRAKRRDNTSVDRGYRSVSLIPLNDGPFGTNHWNELFVIALAILHRILEGFYHLCCQTRVGLCE